jgi:serine/threonine protein kinase
MSPEIVQGLEPDARSDLYSLGVTLFEALTGRRPFEGKREYEFMRAHLEQIPAAPDSLNPHISARLAGIVLKAIAKNPEDRFQNGNEFLEALAPYGAGPATIGGHSSPSRPFIYPDPPATYAISASVRERPVELSSSVSSSERTPGRWDQKTLSGITQELSLYVGPLARILVNRTVPRTRTGDDLITELAKEITSYPDRQRFMDSCQSLLRTLTS